LNLSKNLQNLFQFLPKSYLKLVAKNQKIGEHILCKFSTNFWGAGKWFKKETKYCQKVLPKVSSNFFESFGNSKFH